MHDGFLDKLGYLPRCSMMAVSFLRTTGVLGGKAVISGIGLDSMTFAILRAVLLRPSSVASWKRPSLLFVLLRRLPLISRSMMAAISTVACTQPTGLSLSCCCTA